MKIQLCGVFLLISMVGNISSMKTPQPTRQPKKNSQHVQEPQVQTHEQQEREQKQREQDEKREIVADWLSKNPKRGPCW